MSNVYGVEAVDKLIAGVVEAQSAILGMIVGAKVSSGEWSEEEAIERMEELKDGSVHQVAKSIFSSMVDVIREHREPYLRVIEGGKKED